MIEGNGKLHHNGLPIQFHPALKLVAKVISVIFHPLFIPVYLSWFVLNYSNLFLSISPADRILLMLRFLVMYTVFPLATVLMSKALGFVSSIHLRTQRDRIIPYIASGVYYFWMWYVLRNQPEFPKQFVMLALAIFIASSIGLLFNTYLKVSMHAISAGVMITFVYLLSITAEVNYGFYISIALLIAGAVCTARLINSNHQPGEVYIGLIIGIVAQLVGYMFTM
jgi:hypothetical protein